jgi:hypothetical protein
MQFVPLNIAIYAIGSAFAAYVLSLAYLNYFNLARPRAAEKNEKVVQDTQVKLNNSQRDYVKNEKIRLTDLGASGQSFMVANVLYIGAVLAFTFYFFKAVDPRANFILSSAAASGVSYFFSTGSGKRREKKKKN